MARKLKRHGIRVCAKNRQQSKHKTPLDSSVTGCVKNASIRNTQRAGRIATRRREDQAMPVRGPSGSRLAVARDVWCVVRKRHNRCFGVRAVEDEAGRTTANWRAHTSVLGVGPRRGVLGHGAATNSASAACSATVIRLSASRFDAAEVSRSVNGPRRERSGFAGFAVYSINNRVSYTSI